MSWHFCPLLLHVLRPFWFWGNHAICLFTTPEGNRSEIYISLLLKAIQYPTSSSKSNARSSLYCVFVRTVLTKERRHSAVQPCPQPVKDSIHRSWVDCTGVKKFKRTTLYAIVNMKNAVKDMRKYVGANVFNGKLIVPWQRAYGSNFKSGDWQWATINPKSVATKSGCEATRVLRSADKRGNPGRKLRPRGTATTGAPEEILSRACPSAPRQRSASRALCRHGLKLDNLVSQAEGLRPQAATMGSGGLLASTCARQPKPALQTCAIKTSNLSHPHQAAHGPLSE